MTYVRSHYRRAAGAAGTNRQPPDPGLDIALYDETGDEPLRDRAGGCCVAENLRYSSSLPGGFAAAEFRLRGPAARYWPGRPGLRSVIRRGGQVVWWGWVEDVRPVGRGDVSQLDVLCLGPGQLLQQRRCSLAYASAITGDRALAEQLSLLPEVAPDFSHLAATGVDLAPLNWTDRPMADLVKLVCEAGDSSGRQMLFALWEPSGRATPANLLSNGHFESPAGVGTTPLPTGWTFENNTSQSGAPMSRATDQAHSAFKSIKSAAAAGADPRLKAAAAPVSAGVSYTLSFWARWGGAQSTVTPKITWRNASGGTISTAAGAVVGYPGATDWRPFAQNFTAPAGAVSAVVTLEFVTDYATVWVDDVALAPTSARPAPDDRPVAHLWPRDSATADYLLWTAALGEDVALDLTTRDLANAVKTTYGDTATAWAEDAGSQAFYRRREHVLSAGEVSYVVAEAIRDGYLARHKQPAREPSSFRLQGPGAVRTAHGAAIHPELLRAGDRLRVADGPLAGEVLLLTQVAYADGVVTCTPERQADAPLLLAKSV